MITRRSLLLGLGSLLAAPAIVRADSLMRIVPWPNVALAGEYMIPADVVARIGLAQIRDILLPGLRKVTGKARWPIVYATRGS